MHMSGGPASKLTIHSRLGLELDSPGACIWGLIVGPEPYNISSGGLVSYYNAGCHRYKKNPKNS